ncbi:Uncharacterised protein (plasmid) [Tsukamurella tyrosinosolvens]|uniref:Uncharacterized protein n=1 Tax=Tsukamurella tyrosinosolvens TaxID=57704 RepID=A0A1H4U950_TSUTY|nr:hypothetical protein [Tsukamurella tyrosinosolvens]KXO92991.1 hypothetical protein AXK58_14065 [Tsukamurella tyrosinosolvens]SEC65235.1 hypothetical protein SAMN04489793_2820 [Tsukamurella tyrosinosolvens]VEH94069.1 Uncharacterised protein [Tsukamurella tyrosinosolvens]
MGCTNWDFQTHGETGLTRSEDSDDAPFRTVTITNDREEIVEVSVIGLPDGTAKILITEDTTATITIVDER